VPNINQITAAAYRLLNADAALTGMCRVRRGAKRPVRSKNPAVTVEIRNFEPGAGEGVWMCDVAVTAYADLLGDGAPDYDMLDGIMERVGEVLSDAELKLTGAKAHPLIEGNISAPDWRPEHAREMYQEAVFGLVFACFK